MPIGVEQQSQLKTVSSPQRRGDFRYTAVGVSHERRRGFSGFCRKVQMKTSKIITFCDLRSQSIELLCGCLWHVPEVITCPLRIACMTSMPAIVHRAAQKDLKPSMGRVSRFTARWSCSTMLLRYFSGG